jgi:hypothetical protein
VSKLVFELIEQPIDLGSVLEVFADHGVVGEQFNSVTIG